MEDNTIQRDAVHGHHGNSDQHPKLATGRSGVEASVSHNVVVATPLLSSLPLHNKISTMVITVADDVSVSPITDVVFSSEGTNVIGSVNPVINFSLSSLKTMSNRTMLESTSSSWSAEEVGAVSIVSLMVPFILLSNVVVIFCVIRFRGLHTPTNYFITSLAAVDIVVALATPFVIVVEVFHFGDATGSRHVMMCLLPNRTLMMACGVSVLTLAAIAYDRHTALVSPLEYVTIMTSRKVIVMVTASWIYSLLIVWLPLVVGWYNVPSHGAPCSGNLIHGKAPVLFLGAIFAPSCLVILICYFRIFIVARQHVKAIAAVELSVHRRLQAKVIVKDTKYATTLALIIGAFLALWLPYLLYIFTKTVISMKFDIWVQTYLIFLAVLNSGINPWIYAFKNNELRSALRRLHWELCGVRYCRPVVRKSCQVSAISSCQVSVISHTPRLSLTDSNMVSYFTDASLYTYCEKQARNLKHMGYDATFPFLCSRPRSGTHISELSSQASSISLKGPVRQAASCSNLGSLMEANSLVLLEKCLKSSPSSRDLVMQSVAGQCALNEDGSYHQVASRKLNYRRQLSLETLSETSKMVVKGCSIQSSPSLSNVKTSSLLQNNEFQNQIVSSQLWLTCVSSFKRPELRAHHFKTSSASQHHPEALLQATSPPTELLHTSAALTLHTPQTESICTSPTLTLHTPQTEHTSPTQAQNISPTEYKHTLHTPTSLKSSTESLHTLPTPTPHTPSTIISDKIATSTLPPHTSMLPSLFSHTERSSTLPPHTSMLPSLFSHTERSSTLPPHTSMLPSLFSHTERSSTLPPHTRTARTLSPHTLSSSTLPSHTRTSPTLSPHAITSPTLPPHTRRSLHIPSQIKSSSSSLHTHTTTASKLGSTTSLPLTIVSTKLQPYTPTLHTQQLHTIALPTTHLQSCTVLSPAPQQLHTTVSSIQQSCTVLSPAPQLHMTVSSTQQSCTVLSPAPQQLHTTVSSTQQSCSELSPAEQPDVIRSSIFQPYQTIVNYIESTHHNFTTHCNRTLQ